MIQAQTQPASPRFRPCLSLRLLATAIFFLTLTPLHAQGRPSALSDREVDKLREAANLPPDRVLLFVHFVDARTASIRELSTHPRQPGREQDIHDLLEQVTSIVDELNDNLDDYGPRHLDIRKSLPRLLKAAERWTSEINTPPDHEAYTVSRKLALESIADLREQATRLVEEQRAWFLAHPPPKAPELMDIPR